MALRTKRGANANEFIYDRKEFEAFLTAPVTVIKEADGYCHVIPSCKKCKIVDGICKRCKQTIAQVVARELKHSAQ